MTLASAVLRAPAPAGGRSERERAQAVTVTSGEQVSPQCSAAQGLQW